MCELLGLSFNKTVDANLSFRGFRHRGDDNPDGWGLAYYEKNTAKVIKEDISAMESKTAESLITKNIKSKIFISHVRYSSVGSNSYNNTHPFRKKLFDKDFIFAHNGSLKNFSELILDGFQPDGETDSEHAFCYILEQLNKSRITYWDESNFDLLEDILREINEFGTFNCIMSDGEYLFCYRDMKGYNNLMCVERKAPFEYVRLKDEDFEINLAEEKDLKQRGFIIATNSLTNENWHQLEQGKLIVLKDGNILRR